MVLHHALLTPCEWRCVNSRVLPFVGFLPVCECIRSCVAIASLSLTIVAVTLSP